ncbi:MAG: hypothetical protein NT030_05730 [Candidatus Saganbacteria bacterium]|nr:hypothetical protein [Candidatus Saganbacteria bacterium]
MTEEGTSSYWRKLLAIDEPAKEDILAKFAYPHRILRPFLYFIVEILMKIYLRVEVFGKENLPDKEPYILAPNHCSLYSWDV